MKTNLERFEEDIKKLISKSKKLEYAMIYSVNKEKFIEQFSDLPKEKLQNFLDSLPDFYLEYDTWYSESLALIRQLLPDRLENFKSFYEKPNNRKEVVYGNYVIQDFLQRLSVTRNSFETIVDGSAAIPQFQQQISILKAASNRFKSSLFDIKQIVQADLFDNELESAKALLKKSFFRAAGAVAGVVLEAHLMQVCTDHNLKVKKNPTISNLNEVLKSNGVIDLPQWRYISLLGDLRNLCDHKKESDPTKDNISDLIYGVEKVLKTVF